MFLGVMLVVVAIFLILLVLVQRGRGGGLAGALGGLGGSSAFGTRAGDQFTWITYGTAIVWILLCIAAARWGATTDSRLDVQGPPPAGAADGLGMSAAPAKDDAGAKDDASAKDDSPAKAGEGAAAPRPAADDGKAATPPAEPAPATTEP